CNRRDLIVGAPQEEYRLVEARERAVQLGEVMATCSGERRRGGTRAIELRLDAVDARLGDVALVAIRERCTILDALAIVEPEQPLADAAELRPAEEARHLFVVDVRAVQRDLPRARRLSDC